MTDATALSDSNAENNNPGTVQSPTALMFSVL